jgi:hypothetical protein
MKTAELTRGERSTIRYFAVTRVCMLLLGLCLIAATINAVNSPSWDAKAADNICGISNLRKVSNPATVDYQKLLLSTQQIKRMKKEKVSPDSTLGKLLRAEAAVLITKGCEDARVALGYCSVWKSITNTDGRAVPRITDKVVIR